MKYFLIIFSLLVLGCSGSNSSNTSVKLEGAPAPFDGSKKVHFALIRQMVEGEFM